MKESKREKTSESMRFRTVILIIWKRELVRNTAQKLVEEHEPVVELKGYITRESGGFYYEI